MAKSVKKNAIAKMILNILNVVLPLITGPYIARTLDEILYANYNGAFTVVSWFIPFASFGIYNYGIRIISQVKKDKEKTEKVFTTLFSMGCISSVVVTIIYLIYVIINPGNISTALYVILAIQVISNIFAVEWMNEAFESYGFILIKTMIVRIINVVSIFIFIRKPDDILKYAVITSSVVLINNLLSYIYIKKHVSFTKISRIDLIPLFKPLLVMVLMSNANMFYNFLDRLYLTYFGQKEVYVTYYTLSQMLTGLVVSIISSFVVVTIPRLSNYIGEKRSDEYKNLLYSSSRMYFMIGIPMCIGISVLGTPIMSLYAGEKYIAAGTTLNIYAVKYILGMCDLTLANQVIFIHGKEKLLTKYYFIGGFINLILNTLVAFIGEVTPINLIITTFISEMVLIYLMLRCIRKNISKDIHVINKSTFKYLLISCAFYPIVIVLQNLMGLDYSGNKIFFIAKLGVIVIICSLFYFSVLFFTKDSALKQLLDVLFGKLKSKLSNLNIK